MDEAVLENAQVTADDKAYEYVKVSDNNAVSDTKAVSENVMAIVDEKAQSGDECQDPWLAEDDLPKLWLLQHEELSKLRIEEKNTDDYEVMAHSLAEIDGQLKELLSETEEGVGSRRAPGDGRVPGDAHGAE